jgi:fluoroquinolone resistance protein
MDKVSITGKAFAKIDFTENGIQKGDYESCRFENCNFSSVNLSEIRFYDCIFKSCDLSLVKLTQTAFRDAKFIDCKLLGMRFEHCNDFLFAVDFENCNLNLSSFYKKNLKKVRVKNCTLVEADFTESDLMASVFDNCDLSRATFDHSNLEKADFRTSFNYSIDPEVNRIKKAKFSLAGIAGLLDKYDIVID